MPEPDLREIAQRVVDKWDSEKDSMMQITLTDDGIETGPVTDPDSVLLARAYLDLTAPLTGAGMIVAERQRQIESEGWTTEHDDGYYFGQMAEAAKCYIWASRTEHQHLPREWPWPHEWWKPSTDPVRNLVKAGALIAAEIDRLRRKK